MPQWNEMQLKAIETKQKNSPCFRLCGKWKNYGTY